MTEEQKHAIDVAVYFLKESGRKGTIHLLKDQFPEAFEEPKPEREHIDVRIEKNKSYSVLTKQLIIRHLTTEDHWNKMAELTVTELPAPESNGWTDELVIKFTEYWRGYTGTITQYSIDCFKQENNIK